MSSQQHTGDDHTEDTQAEDEQAGGEPAPTEQDEAPAADGAEAGDAGAPPEPSGDDGPEDERIAQVAERIDKARSQAEDAGVLVDVDEEHYADSGATETEDDQTIAPPG